MRRLIIRPGAIGDFIVSLPALESLRTDYTEVWTASLNCPLVRFADRVDSIYNTGIDSLPPDLSRLSGFDSIVSWYGSNRPEFRQTAVHLPVQFHPALPAEGSLMHATDFYLEQVGRAPGLIPKLPIARRDEGFVAIHPFSGGSRKNWPLERFGELARQVSQPVEWIAGPEEKLNGAKRFDNLWELAQWLARATLYVGNDSGISHLAAAVGTPAIVLFGPTDPRVWAPRGPDVRVVSSASGRMDSICVEDVLAYLRK